MVIAILRLPAESLGYECPVTGLPVSETAGDAVVGSTRGPVPPTELRETHRWTIHPAF